MNRPLDLAKLRAQIAFARVTFLNDGAEGETVHALCDAAEQMTAAIEEAHVALRDADALGGVAGDTPTGDAIDRAREALRKAGSR